MYQLTLLLLALANAPLSAGHVDDMRFPALDDESVIGLSEQRLRIEQLGVDGVIYFDAPISARQQTFLR